MKRAFAALFLALLSAPLAWAQAEQPQSPCQKACAQKMAKCLPGCKKGDQACTHKCSAQAGDCFEKCREKDEAPEEHSHGHR